MEEAHTGSAEGEGAEGNDGLAWVWRDGKLRREAPPPPSAIVAAVAAGPGLDTIPPPEAPREWKRKEQCRCGADELNAREFPEAVRVLYGFPLPHLAHCPLFIVAVGCPACRSGEGAHFHDKHILYENGKELY